MFFKNELPNGYDWVHLDNNQFNSTLESVIKDDDNLFIQAKAGCGKSLIIKIASLMLKNVVVLSTTGTTAIQLSSEGIAAKTIHSFFQFAPTSIIKDSDIYKLYGSTREIIKKAEILIIDEVSMLNAQIFDSIIKKLEFIRKGTLPRLILFGDVLQLPPIINDFSIMDFFNKNYNGNTMFFNSKFYKNLNFKIKTLDKSYRQSDPIFADMLYKISIGSFNQETLDYFNKKVMTLPEYEKYNKNYIYMSATNAVVNKINNNYINNLISDKSKVFKIEKSKNFPDKILQNEIMIKIGAQVMITKNNYEEGYSNGMIGNVIAINDDSTVSIKLETGKIVTVGISKYEIYDTYIEDGIIKNKIKSWAKQIDCKICKAMTIHKSQGKTFDNAYIALTNWTPPGLVYVGLSRLTTLNGLGLSRNLNFNDIKVFEEASKFLQSELLLN